MPRPWIILLLSSVLVTSALGGQVGYAAFANDTQESFEGIAAPLAAPNFGVTGIRGPTPPAFPTAMGLIIDDTGASYINDWAFGQANISSTGISVNSVNDVIDGTAYLFNNSGRVMITLPYPATRWGCHMGGNGVQNETFDMYLGPALVDTVTFGALNFNTFTGWQSAQMFDRIEWDGGHSGYDLFCFDNALGTPPTCTITEPAGPVSGDVSLPVDTASQSSPTVDLLMEYSVDAGMTWSACTAAVGSPLPNPAMGVATGPDTFLWDSRVDGVGWFAVAAGVLVQMTVDDGVAQTPGVCATAPFDVDNTVFCNGVCGDCDEDSQGPDILDALTAAQIAASVIQASPVQLLCCDGNNSGGVDVIDALLMAQVAALLPVTLACP